MKKHFLFFLILFACSPKEEIFHPKAIVISVIGDVVASGKKVQLTQEITDKDTITVGKNSMCDLQLLESDTLVVIRVKANSKFQLTGKMIGSKRENFFTILFGNAIFNVSNVSDTDGIQTVTPTITAGVRGTKYEVNVSQNGSTKVLVLEGKLRTKPRIPELEQYSKSEIKKNKVLKLVAETIEDKEIDIKKGESSEISAEAKSKILKETGIPSTRAQGEPNDFGKNVDLNKLEDRLTEIEKQDMNYNKQEIDPKSMDQKLKEYDEITPFEKEKINNKEKRNQLIQVRFKSIEDSWLKRFQEWLKGLNF